MLATPTALARSLTLVGLVALAGSSTSLARATPQEEATFDVLVDQDGKEISGRVLEAFDPEVWRIRSGSKVLELDRAEVSEARLRNDRLRAFLDQRKSGMDAESAAVLAEQGAAAGLEGISRAQAYHALLLDSDNLRAHEFLDHKQRGKRWRWRLDGKLLSEERFQEAFEEMGSAPVLRGLHFEVRSDAGLRAAVDTLFDLERLYVTWLDQFGPALQPFEILEPIRVQLHGSQEDMSFHSFVLRHVHYDPGRLLGNAQQPEPRILTYLPGIGERPVRLFDLGAQALLYHGMLGEQLTLVNRDTRVYRECTLIEIGFGGWFQRRLSGPLGHAQFSPDVQRDAILFDLAQRPLRSEPLEGVPLELERLILLAYGRLQLVRAENPLYWARCRAWGEFFMDPEARLEGNALRQGWTRAVRKIYAGARGSTRSVWETAFGTTLEELQATYDAWLRQV